MVNVVLETGRPQEVTARGMAPAPSLLDESHTRQRDISRVTEQTRGDVDGGVDTHWDASFIEMGKSLLQFGVQDLLGHHV